MRWNNSGWGSRATVILSAATIVVAVTYFATRPPHNPSADLKGDVVTVGLTAQEWIKSYAATPPGEISRRTAIRLAELMVIVGIGRLVLRLRL